MAQDITAVEIRKVIESDVSVPADRVRAWMKSDDLEVQAGIVIIISEYQDRIDPPIEGETIFRFCLNYYKRCFLENPPDGEFTANRTVEGYALHNWFKILWGNKESNSRLLDEIKRMVADVYVSGDAGSRYAIETAFLEHLFEDREIEAYFSDWKCNVALKDAYDRAREWGTAKRAGF